MKSSFSLPSLFNGYQINLWTIISEPQSLINDFFPPIIT